MFDINSLRGILFILVLGLGACAGETENGNNSAVTEGTNVTASAMDAPSHYELKIFEVTDSVKSQEKGWGYDIYKDGSRMIHQPIIPARPGNNSFSSEEKARKVGTFAMEKMKRSGSLPTISMEELDSLGI